MAANIQQEMLSQYDFASSALRESTAIHGPLCDLKPWAVVAMADCITQNYWLAFIRLSAMAMALAPLADSLPRLVRSEEHRPARSYGLVPDPQLYQDGLRQVGQRQVPDGGGHHWAVQNHGGALCAATAAR